MLCLLPLLVSCAATPIVVEKPAPLPDHGLIHTRAGYPAHWPADAFPIRLLVHEATPVEYDIQIWMAAQAFNIDVGAEVFVIEKVAEVPEPEHVPEGSCTVQLAMLPGRLLGVTQFVLAKWPHPDPGRFGRCHVGVDPRLHVGVFQDVVKHELGHVVGLADVEDPDSTSLMVGVMPQTPEARLALYLPRDMIAWIRHQMGLEPYGNP